MIVHVASGRTWTSNAWMTPRRRLLHSHSWMHAWMMLLLLKVWIVVGVCNHSDRSIGRSHSSIGAWTLQGRRIRFHTGSTRASVTSRSHWNMLSSHGRPWRISHPLMWHHLWRLSWKQLWPHPRMHTTIVWTRVRTLIWRRPELSLLGWHGMLRLSFRYRRKMWRRRRGLISS